MPMILAISVNLLADQFPQVRECASSALRGRPRIFYEWQMKLCNEKAAPVIPCKLLLHVYPLLELADSCNAA